MNINKETLERAIQEWGTTSQLNMVIEECLELASATHKMITRRNDVSKVIDEMADVIIVVEQMKIIFKDYENQLQERIDFKMRRLEARLIGEDLKEETESSQLGQLGYSVEQREKMK